MFEKSLPNLIIICKLMIVVIHGFVNIFKTTQSNATPYKRSIRKIQKRDFPNQRLILRVLSALLRTLDFY